MRTKRVNYPLLDSLLIEGKPTIDITVSVGCSAGTVKNRRRYLADQGKVTIRTYTKQPKKETTRLRRGKYDDGDMPFIPFQQRFENALLVTAENLGQSLEWVKTVWIKGSAGQSFLKGYEGMI